MKKVIFILVSLVLLMACHSGSVKTTSVDSTVSDSSVLDTQRDESASLPGNPKADGEKAPETATINPEQEDPFEQARQDAAKGIITLPEPVQEGSASWFRKFM